jgi:hypothetical protein
MTKLVMALGGAGLAALATVLAVARAGTGQTTTTRVGTLTATVADVSGPCDEAEHANDPRCTGAAAPQPQADDDDQADDDGPNHEAGDDNGDDGPNHDVNDDHGGRRNRGSDDSVAGSNRGSGSSNSGSGNSGSGSSASGRGGSDDGPNHDLNDDHGSGFESGDDSGGHGRGRGRGGDD